jgi:hypothetical protein
MERRNVEMDRMMIKALFDALTVNQKVEQKEEQNGYIKYISKYQFSPLLIIRCKMGTQHAELAVFDGSLAEIKDEPILCIDWNPEVAKQDGFLVSKLNFMHPQGLHLGEMMRWATQASQNFMCRVRKERAQAASV